MREVERRYLLTPQILERLAACGLEWSPARRVIDITLGPHGAESMTRDGWVLRLRQDGERKLLQYKKALDGSGQGWSELSVEVNSLSILYDMLLMIGLSPGLVIARTRSNASMGACEITLDELDHLGSFLEIASEDDDAARGKALVAAVEQRLLTEEDKPQPPYGQLLRAKLADDPVLRARLKADIRQILAHERDPA